MVLFGDEKSMIEYNRITARTAGELKLPYIDLDTPMRKLPNRKELFVDGVHLSAKGNLLMAWNLIQFLKQR